MSTADSLQEALDNGQGVERPFRCPDHDDHFASASVNVVKGVWYCFSCQANGKVGSKKAPKLTELEAMMRPEITPRIYPEAFLELYIHPIYWRSRFPAWLCHVMGLGEDPFTSDATFPVYTGTGLFAGVGRRKQEVEEHESRYRYPAGWSASQSLFGTRGRYRQYDVIALGEGPADASAIWETGCPGLAVYGSGVHLPQLDLIARYAPKLILLGFDMDAAGDRATTAATQLLSSMAIVQTVHWPKKDPGESPVHTRTAALQTAVAQSGYGKTQEKEWTHNVESMQTTYQSYCKEMNE